MKTSRFLKRMGRPGKLLGEDRDGKTIEATLTLSRDGRAVWFEKTVSRTHVPLPGLPAYQASRNSVGTRRGPEFERLLYEDARDDLPARRQRPAEWLCLLDLLAQLVALDLCLVAVGRPPDRAC